MMDMTRLLEHFSPLWTRSDVAAAARTRTAAGSRPGLRRTGFFGLVGLTTIAATFVMTEVLSANGMSLLEVALLILFAVNLAWIALSFWTAVAGFFLRLLGRDPLSLRPRESVPRPNSIPRTAIVMPVFQEDPERVFAGLEAIYKSVDATGRRKDFDFFVLSDTRDEHLAKAELAAWRDFGRRMDGARVFYRRRRDNTGRKAGNIADFCRRWGRRYTYMVVLDADSLMSGETILELVARMEAHPGMGLLQTQPVPVGRETLFARFVQFASRLYGPMLASGASFWQLGESNFWGHNAIIRTQAFMAHCGLPELPGRPPLGGQILSHDFVEAALLRRAGWQVCFADDLEGSYEEVPTNLIDYAQRDRRWCQGNLQHLKLVAARGLHPLSRLHLLCGAQAYLASLFWLAMLVLTTVAIIGHALVGHAYFPFDYQLHPIWPVFKSAEIHLLLAATMVLLWLPKLLGLVLALVNGGTRRSFGGGGRLLLSAGWEALFSVLIAPLMMAFHTLFVISVLAGWSVQWSAQARDERGLSPREAARRMGPSVLLGLFWGIVLWWFAFDFIWWFMPILAGLWLGVPLALWSSRIDLGRWARAKGLLLTPEEKTPPPILHGLQAALRNGISEEARTGATMRESQEVPEELVGEMLTQILDPPWSRTSLHRTPRRIGAPKVSTPV